MKVSQNFKKKKYTIWEHLEFSVKKTTYTHRLQWLQEANEWVRLLKKNKIIPLNSRKS